MAPRRNNKKLLNNSGATSQSSAAKHKYNAMPMGNPARICLPSNSSSALKKTSEKLSGKSGPIKVWLLLLLAAEGMAGWSTLL